MFGFGFMSGICRLNHRFRNDADQIYFNKERFVYFFRSFNLHKDQ